MNAADVKPGDSVWSVDVGSDRLPVVRNYVVAEARSGWVRFVDQPMYSGSRDASTLYATRAEAVAIWRKQMENVAEWADFVGIESAQKLVSSLESDLADARKTLSALVARRDAVRALVAEMLREDQE